MPRTDPDRVEIIRRFNRFYTRQIGLLREGLLESRFSLTQARVLYELAHHDETTVTDLAGELALDAGYLSRVLAGLEEDGLVTRRRSSDDRRRYLLSLSAGGQEEYSVLDAASRRDIQALLDDLPEVDRGRLVHAMSTVESLLGGGFEDRVPYILRPHHAGDMGWVVHRHGVLYAREMAFGEAFEALVARIVADFVDGYDRTRERCWIAEREGENVGSVFLIRHRERDGVAQLRLLLVEPRARGLGIGQRLVHECTRFARQAGYHTVALWTNSELGAARRIYEHEGYRLVAEEPYGLFDEGQTQQHWELEL